MTTPKPPDRVWMHQSLGYWFSVADECREPQDIEYVRADLAPSIAGVPAQQIHEASLNAAFNLLPYFTNDADAARAAGIERASVNQVAAIIEEELSRGIEEHENQDQVNKENSV